jgi:tetratricopeptide (TPR) repeat protein
MKPYKIDDFNNNEAWLVFRIDTQVQEQPVDIYMLLDLPSNQVLIHETVVSELSQKQATQFLKQGLDKKGDTPSRILLTQGDPAESVLRKAAKNLNISLELVLAPYLEQLIAPIKKSFGQAFYSPSSLPYAYVKEGTDEFDQDTLKYMVPDSYDLCSCASGKKYKFCCKKIFREIMEAMTTAEDGKLSEALEWIAKAKNIVGETAEVVCREAIIYSFFDTEKSEAILNKCLEINPNHPRAHYLRAITLTERDNHQGVIAAYETAIRNYPRTDHYHLNEAYHNLGTAFYAIGDLLKAKAAWEQALLHLPADKMTKRNLEDFIYNKKVFNLDISHDNVH